MNQEALKIDLKNCENLKQYFDTIQKYYDCSAPLGIGAKTSLLLYLPQLITLTNIKPKQ